MIGVEGYSSFMFITADVLNNINVMCTCTLTESAVFESATA